MAGGFKDYNWECLREAPSAFRRGVIVVTILANLILAFGLCPALQAWGRGREPARAISTMALANWLGSWGVWGALAVIYYFPANSRNV